MSSSIKPHEDPACACAACVEFNKPKPRCICGKAPNGNRKRHPYCQAHG